MFWKKFWVLPKYHIKTLYRSQSLQFFSFSPMLWGNCVCMEWMFFALVFFSLDFMLATFNKSWNLLGLASTSLRSELSKPQQMFEKPHLKAKYFMSLMIEPVIWQFGWGTGKLSTFTHRKIVKHPYSKIVKNPYSKIVNFFANEFIAP